eukprot:COSAG06_NODE_13019_length_1302_cov_0.939318_3_plen_59_part_01
MASILSLRVPTGPRHLEAAPVGLDGSVDLDRVRPAPLRSILGAARADDAAQAEPPVALR